MDKLTSIYYWHIIFAAGMYIYVLSDYILLNLREENDKGYHTP